jgi:two-component system phosphate regulon sensor histidine kinase PhoR
MNAKPYKLIFILLILSVLSVFVLQAFWIRNFYIQKQDEFNQTVYAALEKVSTKLDERQKLQAAKEKIVLDHSLNTTSRENTKSAGGTLVTTYAQVRNTKKGSTRVSITKLETIKNDMQKIQIADSSIVIHSPGLTIVKRSGKKKQDSNKKEIDKLIDKMLMEIRIIDTDERNGDTLKNIIKKIFANKGLFMPFEFALKKIFKNKDETLARSSAFNEKAVSFVTDLSTDKVFSTHNFLFIQFPTINNFVFSSMKNILLLSLLFSLLISTVFYYTIRLILNQKKLNEIKNDFVNNMTHELKTPIATISLALDSINNPEIKNNEEHFKEYTRILKEENRKLNRHVERVLQMAQLDRGELQIMKTQSDLVKILESSLKTFALLIEDKKAKVRFDPAAAEIKINADEEHLKAVFDNLLDNALKYSGDNCEIQISIKRNEGIVSITFKDNGIGIGSEHQEKIFDRFYRAQGGNLHDVKGFGLGLSYVKSMVEAHGGNIEVKSEKGKGSEFIIKFRT